MSSPIVLDVIVDTVQVEAALLTLSQRLDVGMVAWMQNDLVDHLQERARNRFASGGDDASGPWAPLRPATVAIRGSLGFPPSGPINIRTHDLYNYIVGDNGSVSYSAGWTLSWPNLPGDKDTNDKLQTAQRGKPSPNTTDRPVVALGPGDYTNIMANLAVFLTTGLI